MTERLLEIDGALAARNDAMTTDALPVDLLSAPRDLRAALRQATADLHRHLDGAPDQRSLVAADLTLDRYATIMVRHQRALMISEATLAALEPVRPRDLPPYRPRLPALDADLATLPSEGRPIARLDARDGPAGEPAPTADDVGALGRYVGTRYVLEGSTQGARHIARRLEQHLPTLRRSAFAYWRLQADETTAWQALTLTLASLPPRGPLATAAIAAARATFGVFLRAFDVDVRDVDVPDATADDVAHAEAQR